MTKSIQLKLYLLCFLFSTQLSLAQPVCQISSPFPENKILVPSVGMFGYNGASLVLLPKGQKTPVVLRNFPGVNSSITTFIASMNNKVYFTVYESVSSVVIWESDGTIENTKAVFTVPNISEFYVIHNYLYYQTVTYPDTYLWKSDGHSTGKLISTINTLFNKSILNSGDFFDIDLGTYYKGDYYFTGYHGGAGAVVRIPASNPDVIEIIFNNSSSRIVSYLVYNNKLFFRKSLYNWQLWATDGTVEGTKNFLSIYEMDINLPFVHKNKLYFAATNGTNKDIYVSEGTIETTKKAISSYGNEQIDKAISAGDYFYFVNSLRNNDSELWRSDGTLLGTQMAKDIRPGIGSGYNDTYLVNIIAKDSIVYFTGSDRDGNRDVWRSNGTEKGTYKVIDFGYPNSDGSPTNYFLFENALYFNAKNYLSTLIPNQSFQISVKPGQWNIASTWSGCRVPLAGDSIKINHAISLPSGYKAVNIKTAFSEGGKLQILQNSRVVIGQ